MIPPDRSSHRAGLLGPSAWKLALAALLGALFVNRITRYSFFDPDGFHAMALFREWLRTGALPLVDPFAFTDKFHPLVHHEWGAGVILYSVTTTLGATGVVILRWLLVLFTVVLAWRAALRRAPFSAVALCAPVAIVLCHQGFTTIRAGVYTLLFLALVLWLIDRDRDSPSAPRFLAVYLPVLAIWINLHGGWVVGVAAVGLHGLEQVARRRPWRHLLAAVAATPVFMLATPYGRHYPAGWWRSVSYPRHLILEWRPLIERAHPASLLAFVVALLFLIYAGVRRGPRRMPGLPFLVLSALAALRHERHIVLFGLIWFCTAPGYLTGTPLEVILSRIDVRGRIATAVSIAAALGALGLALLTAPRHPFTLRIPAQPADLDEVWFAYPTGVVDYLRREGFRGKLFNTFEQGGFISWCLYPEVRVSIDGRHEAAFADGVLEDHLTLVLGEPGWREVLAKYDPDALLLRKAAPIADLLPAGTDLQLAYVDDLFQVWARKGVPLTPTDRRGSPLPAWFP